MVIRSAIFNIAFIAWTFTLGILSMPVSAIHPSLAIRVARLWAFVSLWLLRIICGITYETRGQEYIPGGKTLVASKHQSAFDTIIFWNLLKRPVYVLKRELLYIPVFGWHLLLLKSIYIDRSAGASAIKFMLRRARERLAKNRTIVIFPEGTRTTPGEKGTYHPGIAALYHGLNVAVTPVALTSGLYWGKKAFVKKPGKIIIEFLPPIQPGLKAREFMTLLEERIETASRALIENP